MKINEKHFNIGFVLATLGIILYLVLGGTIEKDSIIGMLGAINLNLSIFFISSFGLQYFLKDINLNILDEIVDKKNIAASIYMGFLFLSIAIIISKAI